MTIDYSKYNDLERVFERVFFDVSADGEPCGRIIRALRSHYYGTAL